MSRPDRLDEPPEVALEHIGVLAQRRGYLLGSALRREREGLRAELERREAVALSWAIQTLERLLDEKGQA